MSDEATMGGQRPRGTKMASGSLIAPVIVPKASDILASRLRDLIVNGQFTPGDFLPTERELVAESGLSRTSVRDALRVLESDGLITTKVGRTGGSMVTLPGRESTPFPESAFRYVGNVATNVFPSPVAISAIRPECRTIPPIS